MGMVKPNQNLTRGGGGDVVLTMATNLLGMCFAWRLEDQIALVSAGDLERL